MTDNLELARIAEHRAERRRVEAERRGQIRRRRIVALGALLVGAGVVATLISSAFGGGEGAESPAGGPLKAAAPPPEGSLGAQLALGSTTNSGLAADAPVPILMYHVISAPPADASLPELFVDPDDFRRQVAYLAEQGFTAITLEQLFAAWLHGAPAPAAPIVLSFDDGYASQYTDAMPILEEQGWPGVLNLKVDSLEQGELTESQVTEMIDAGWEVDAHTITHPDLTTLDDATLEKEVAGSRRKLQKTLGAPVDFFCYPAGAFDERVVAAVEAAGYEGATTTERGLATAAAPFELPRIRIDGSDGVDGLATKLEGAIEEDSA